MTVYFINELGGNCCVKIGYTGGDVHQRLASLQTGNSSELSIFGEIPDGSPVLEKAIQVHFSEYYVRGEWFNIPIDVLEPFMDLCVWPWKSEDEIFDYLGINTPKRTPRQRPVDADDPDNWRIERREYVKQNGEVSIYTNYRRRKGKYIDGKRVNIYRAATEEQ